jgi:prephenate dehydratase
VPTIFLAHQLFGPAFLTTMAKSPLTSPKTVAFQGMLGAYSDSAARALYPKAKLIPCAHFHDVFERLAQGKADRAVIPIDNTIAGRVADIHHLLPQYDFYFVGELFLKIDHCLLAPQNASLKTIQKVYSHAHALPQCRGLIKSLKLEPVVYADTAGSAQYVAQLNDPKNAAIASDIAAKAYGLQILKRHIADEKNNLTRFLALSRTPIIPPLKAHKNYITSFFFHVKNRPAALYKALGGFATAHLNMLKLESYMPGGQFSSSFFYCEVLAHQQDPKLQQSIEELAFFSYDMRILGCYETDDKNRQKLHQTAHIKKDNRR